MKKALFTFLFVAVSLAVFSQDIKKLVVNTPGKLDVTQAIFVTENSSDPILVSDLLKNALASNGFKVVTEKTAATYNVTFKYTDRSDTGCGGRVMKDFSGQVTDIANGGQIIATFTFSQNSFEGRCAGDIMNALAKKLKG